MINLWPLLLPIATGSGWLFAKRKYTKNEHEGKSQRLSEAYVVGLNYLLNEQTDKALDVFMKLLDDDSDTVETHLALGSLFRRRGELDRATRIHQNLIARPQLSYRQKTEALLALGQDYLCAGVYDRAERTFKEVVDLGGDKVKGSLIHLIAIYEQEKSWLQAINVLSHLEKVTSERASLQMGHYYCELAENEMANAHVEQAMLYLKKAQYSDKNSVRASMLLGGSEQRQQRFRQAINAYKKVPLQDEAFLSEVVEPLFTCYKALGQQKECIRYFNELLIKHPRASIIFILAEDLRETHSVEEALDFVSEQLNLHPSLRGLNKLIKWYLEATYGKVRGKLKMLFNITSTLIENKPVYRCGHCGFSGNHLHWQCPGCKSWSTVKPICGLEGD